MTFRVRQSVFVLSFLLAACSAENNFPENSENQNSNLVLDDLILDDPTQETIITEPAAEEASVTAEDAVGAAPPPSAGPSPVSAPQNSVSPSDEGSLAVPSPCYMRNQ